MANRKLNRASVMTAVAGLALLVGGGAAFAGQINNHAANLHGIVVNYDGNGTTDGACNLFLDTPELSPGPGQQGWQFNLTNADDNHGSDLTFALATGSAISTSPVAGVHSGPASGGIYKYFVYTTAGATLDLTPGSVFATNGTPQSVLTVSHCELGQDQQESSMSSEVHLDGTHAVVDNSDPAPVGAMVHDSVTLTVNGVITWSGTLHLEFFETNDCSGDAVDSISIPWSNTDPSTRDDLLPEGPIGAGGFSYHHSFDSANDALDSEGACEPFLAETTQTSGPPPSSEPPPSSGPPPSSTTPCTGSCLPRTGAALSALIIAGGLMIVGGFALIVARRRREQFASAAGGSVTPDAGAADSDAWS